jgi:hypothetical protein
MTRVEQPDVTVGWAGVEAAMMQLNRTPDEQPDVTVGRAGVEAAMMQLNR